MSPVPGDMPMLRSDVGFIADEVVKRLAGNQLPADTGAWVREQAKGGALRGQQLIGYSGYPLTMGWTLEPDGRIELRLYDVQYRIVWETILRPVEGG